MSDLVDVRSSVEEAWPSWTDRRESATGRLRHAAATRSSAAAQRIWLRCRCEWFRALSTNRGAFRGASVASPVLAIGAGTIVAEGAFLGYFPSPHAMDGCSHIEARYPDSTVTLGRGVVVNNGSTIIAAGPGIWIGEDTLLGPQVMIFDSDFHSTDPGLSRSGAPAVGEVRIGPNVFVGTRVVILKGVTIGANSVIAAGSIVVDSIPDNVVAAGNPCRKVAEL